MLLFLMLGLLDVACAVVMVLASYDIFNWRAAIIASFYLMGKGFIFRGSWLSVFDIAAGVLLLLTIAGLRAPLLAFIVLAVMLYKLAISIIVR